MVVFASALCVQRTALAAEIVCDTPDYMDAGGVGAEDRPHFHPSLTIVYYHRSSQGTKTVHDVTKLVVPPAELGVDVPVSGQIADRKIRNFRRIHNHDDSGVLHVEPAQGGVLRLCQFLKIWASSGTPIRVAPSIEFRKSAHVRVGEQYTKNVPIEKILNIPLNHNMPIILFLEDAVEM